MSLKQAYMRKFIILEEQSVNYSEVNNQKPKGHVKLEVRDGKGKITLNVDGLNSNISDDNVYKGYLLSNENLKLTKIDIGSIILNGNGRGSTEWQFNPLSVGGTDVSIESFNVILVKLCSKNQQDDDFIVPLAGYIQNADGSIPMILNIFAKDIRKENNAELKHYHKEEKKIETEKTNEVQENELEEEIEVQEVQKVVEEMQETEELEETEDIHDEEEIMQKDELLEVDQTSDEIAEKIENPDEENEEDKYYDSNEIKQVEGNFEDFFLDQNDKTESKPESDTNNQGVRYNYNVYNDSNYGHSISKSNTYIENARNYSKQIANYAMNILKFFDKVDPFKEALEGYKWWEIEYDSKNIYRGFLPFYNYLVNMYYPYPFMTKVTTCQRLIKEHNHYIFGVVEGENEIQYYVYGVPGRFTRDDQPYNGATGFTTWLRNKERSKEDMGYWLIYIDALSGKIVTPLNPTIPPK